MELGHEFEYVRNPYEDLSPVMDFQHYSYLLGGSENTNDAPRQFDYPGHSIEYNQYTQVPRLFEKVFLDPQSSRPYQNSNSEDSLWNQREETSEEHVHNAPLQSCWPSQSVEYNHNTHAPRLPLATEGFVDQQSLELCQKFDAEDIPLRESPTTSGFPFPSVGSSALVPQTGLKRPTSQDWKSWQPMITASYRHSTAPMIMKELRSRGCQVTEKMVRDRLREWRLTTKNAKMKANFMSSASSSYGSLDARHAQRLRKHIFVASEDRLQHRFLHIMGRWLDTACDPNTVRDIEHESPNDGTLFLDFNFATRAAFKINDAYAWKNLHKAGSDFIEIEWLHISLSDMIDTVDHLLDWQYSSNREETKVRLQLLDLATSKLGAEHPITEKMKLVIHEKLTLECIYHLATFFETKFSTSNLDRSEKDSLEDRSRLMLIRDLYERDRYYMMEDILGSWSPHNTEFECDRLLWLAEARIAMSIRGVLRFLPQGSKKAC